MVIFNENLSTLNVSLGVCVCVLPKNGFPGKFKCNSEVKNKKESQNKKVNALLGLLMGGGEPSISSLMGY